MMKQQQIEENEQKKIEKEMQQLLESQGFNVLKTIGHGSFGNVFKVYYSELGEVAAKVIINQFFDENEWNIAGILSEDPPQTCPFIIRNILANQFQESTIIILEFCNCENLQHLIETNVDIPLPTVRVIMRQILQGLSFIHSKGLVHRDIKAANILLHSPIGSGRVIAKIADFGEVKISPEINKSSILMSIRGTPPYMPPEILLGDQNELKYATGGILTRPSSITDDLLWDLLVKMLCFDRNKRISASDALNHPFFTGEQAMREISPEQEQLAKIALEEQRNGDKNISQFDINPQFILSLNELKSISKQDYPETEKQQIKAQNRSSQSPSSPSILYIQPPYIPQQPIQQQKYQPVFDQQQLQNLQESRNPFFQGANIFGQTYRLKISQQQQQQQQQQIFNHNTHFITQQPNIYQQQQYIYYQPQNIPVVPPINYQYYQQYYQYPYQIQQQSFYQQQQYQQQYQYQYHPAVIPRNIRPAVIPSNIQPAVIPSNIQPAIQFPNPILPPIPKQVQIPPKPEQVQIPLNNNIEQQEIMNEDQTEQNESEQQIPCEICNRLIYFSKFKEHEQMHQQEQEQQRNAQQILQSKDDENEPQIPCDICKRMIRFSKYQDHQQQHQQIQQIHQQEQQSRIALEEEQRRKAEQDQYQQQFQTMQQTLSMPINAQPNRYHECPSCGNVFHYRIILNHASQCSQDQKNRLIFNFAQEILPQMELNTGRGYFQAKQGFITKCPLCEQVPKDNINTHVHMLHKDVEQLFQKCLHFHDEMQLP